MKVYVDWSIEPDELYNAFDGYSEQAAAHLLKTDIETYRNMSADARYDILEWMIHHNVLSAAEVIGLEEEIDVPDLVQMEDITEWLSDTYGYFVNGWTMD